MNLDTIARRHANIARLSVARAQSPAVPGPSSARSRAVARFAWAGGASVAVVAGIVAVVMFAGSGRAVLETAPPVADTTSPATVSTTVAEALVILAEPLVTQAQLGPEPAFDTSSLGVEQPIEPVDGLGLDERDRMSRDHELVMDQRAAIGRVPGTTQQAFAATGTINNPTEPGFGGAGRCYWVVAADKTLGECHSLAGVEPVRPIGTGIVGRGWVGWSYLPAESSVAVLVVDGADFAWQRPRGDVALFALDFEPGSAVELRVLDASGTEIARGDLVRPVDLGESVTVPITGYGDYSAVEYWDIDWVEVTAMTAECMADQGFPVTITSDGTGMSFGAIPDDQNRDAQIAHVACRAGLNLPDPVPPTEEQIVAHYEALLEVKRCLEDRGYVIEEPPSLSEWITIYDLDPWHPYESLDDEVASRVHTVCPQP